ncbi:GNAT family N-acetyltransferase [Marinilabiliaceae bacterium JC017]|nr:GNAT family N-acetyltransferase [Marinilabiliaceae bacterium JC017]
MEIIKPLKEISFDKMFEAFSEAFKDYEVQLTKEELQTMLQRRGFVPELSFGLFIDDQLISFTCNGIGSFNGIKTAYDTGTGTIKEYRGQGHASKIFSHSLPFLKEAGVSRYLLEVLQHNTKAVSIYKKLGFKVDREFNYFLEKTENIRFCSKITNSGYQIEQIDLSHIDLMSDFRDFNPSWQNSFEAIRRKPQDFKMMGVFEGQKLLGYCVLEPNTGDVTQIAVDKHYRRRGIGTLLLKETQKFNLHDSVKVINTDVNCESITGFLQANSIPLRGKQFEMTKQL